MHGHKIENLEDTPFSVIPSVLDGKMLSKLLKSVEAASICPGNPDDKFIEMAVAHKGKFSSLNGTSAGILSFG